MLRRIGVSIATMCLVAQVCAAQGDSRKDEKNEPSFFRLDLTVKEVDDNRVVNSRSYSTIASTDHDGSPMIRTGSKAPIRTEGKEGFQYIDLGVNVDYRAIRDRGEAVGLVVNTEVSSAATQSGQTPPVIRQNRWSAAVVLPLGKPTRIFASDDVDSKRRTEVEVTATRIKQ